MTDKKIVTHADLNAIGVIENECSALTCGGEAAELLRRLRAAAEADAPPLPEGWVVYADDDEGDQRVFWHRDGVLYYGRGEGYAIWSVGPSMLTRCTPLRPTITEADLTAAVATLADRHIRQTDSDITRDMFKAAGVEVAS